MLRVTNPLRQLPVRTALSVRRHSSLIVTAIDDWARGIVVNGFAQDAIARPGEPVDSPDSVRLTAELDEASRLVRLAGDLPPDVTNALLGCAPVSGFRAGLRRLPGSGLDPSSLVAALLDDLPTVRLISGYARVIEAAHASTKGRTSSPVLNICRGWAAGGTADRLAAAGHPVVTQTPQAPSFAQVLADHGDWLRDPPLTPRSMRRRRMLDVALDAEGFAILQYLRDSHVDETGREGSLHEYVMSAVVDPGLVIRAISVEPRALPFPECALAAPNAELLVGRSITDVEASVRSLLAGTMGCTHLNDVLRFLRFAEPLVMRLNRLRA
jgi:hypothetical protein